MVPPAVHFVYLYYRMHIFRAVLETLSHVSHDDDVVPAASHSH